MARALIVILAWLALSVLSGYALAGLGAGTFGAAWVASCSAFAALFLCPLLLCAAPD